MPTEQGEEIPPGERAGAILDALPGSARQVAGRTGLGEAYVRQTLSRLKGLGAVRTIGHTVEDVPGSSRGRARATVYARNY